MSLTRDQVDTLTEPEEITEEVTDSGSVRNRRVWHIVAGGGSLGDFARSLCGRHGIIASMPPGDPLCVFCRILDGC